MGYSAFMVWNSRGNKGTTNDKYKHAKHIVCKQIINAIKVKPGKGSWSGEGGNQRVSLRKHDLSKGLMVVKGFAWLAFWRRMFHRNVG